MTDELIVAGLKARDKAAFQQFWDSYYDRIYPICAVILGGGPDALDMTVDILVDFIEKYVDNLSSPRALFTFLRQMAVRRSIRLRDKQKKISCLETAGQIAMDATNPEEEAEMSILMPLLNQCLGNVTPKTQIALRLKYSNKISNERIGHLVGGSKAYIGRILSQGREVLRKCIEKKVRQAASGTSSATNWTPGLKPVVSLAKIETLLTARSRFDGSECEQMGRMVDVLCNITDLGEREWAAGHLAHCAECRESLLTLESVEMRMEVPATRGLMAGESRHIGRDVRKIAPLAAAVLVGLGLSLFFGLNKKMGEVAPSGEELVGKGYSDTLYVAAQRGASSFTVQPLDRLMTNDKLGLFYSARRSGYLAIFSLDNSGEVALLYPTQGTAGASIFPGDKTPLPDGAVVADGSGCEWMIAVFSDAPLKLADIAHFLQGVERTKQDSACALNAAVPGARAVRVLPVKR